MRTTQPWVVMHELMHQVFIALEPAERASLERVYAQAKERSHDRGAYAFRNPDEFLSERSEAWFGVNDSPPVNAAELRAAEPSTAAFLEQLLGPSPGR